MRGIDICNKKFCSGCETCANICPQHAIEMHADWKGFLYPYVDSTKCIDCGLCQRQCPSNKKETKPFKFGYGFVFQEKNDTYLHNATSGGAFGVMARYILQHGGVVFGASMDKAYNINYKAVETIEELKTLHGSKYVQSYVNNVYKHVKDCLEQQRPVLFCGCPCQVAGLKAFLRKNYEMLITMDLICHGVPSQPYFRAYVNDLLKRNSNITVFRFRGKGTSNNNMNNTYIGFLHNDYYMTYFLWGKGYRSSCYHCRFAGSERQGDFTIGDFWNNKIMRLPIDEEKGVSLVLANTQKAKKLEPLFATNGYLFPLKSMTEAMGNDGGQLKHPSKYDVRCDLIYILYKIFGLSGPKLLFKLDNMRYILKK